MDKKSEKLITGKPEKVQEQGKKQRIRRSKKDIIIEKVQKFYQAKVKADVFSAEVEKISASIETLEKNIMKKKKPSNETILELFSADELKALLEQKQAQSK